MAGLPGAVAAQLLQESDATEAQRHASPVQTSYRIVNLCCGRIFGTPVINARGQVAYATALGTTNSGAWFYDGERRHAIGNPGTPIVRPTGVNDAGQVAGMTVTPAGPVHSFIWSRWRGIADIGILPGIESVWDPAINNRGVLAGYATGPAGDRAYGWSAASGIFDLGTLSGGTNAEAYGRAINDAGTITGSSRVSNGLHLFAWTYGSGMVDLEPDGTGNSYPVAISANGLISGNHSYQGDSHAFVWTRRTGLRLLGTTYAHSQVNAMSSDGRIAGLLSSEDYAIDRAMTWTEGGGLRDLGTLGGTRSNASAANNRGQVVGGSLLAGDTRFSAFVWTARQGMVNLETRLRHAPAGLQLYYALAIADNGAIAVDSNVGLVLLKPECGRPCLHTVGPIVFPQRNMPGTPIDFSISIASDTPAATYDVIWDWGDGTTQRTTSTRTSRGQWRASARHNYSSVDTYALIVTVIDQAGRRVAVGNEVRVFAPRDSGGAGTFMSPIKANAGRLPTAGMASFSFAAPAHEGSQRTQAAALRFNVGTLDFHSTSIRTVTRQTSRATFEGKGTIGGTADVRFLLDLSASDAGKGDQGRIGLKIWTIDGNTGNETVVYDTGLEAGAGATVPYRGSVALP